MSDIDDKLNELEAQYNDGRAPAQEVEQTQEVEPIEEPEDNPPGFKDYSTYVGEGGDPETYRGKKAYEAQYDLIQANKELKAGQRQMQETLNQTVSAMGQWKEQQKEQMKSELERDLEEAKAGFDMDGALAITERLSALDKSPAQSTQPGHPQVNSVLEDHVRNSPLLNSSSNQYDASFSNDVAAVFDTKMREFGGHASDTALKSALKFAEAKARELHPHLFKSPKNSRTTMASPKISSKTKSDPTDQEYATNYKIDAKNPANNNAAKELYAIIAKKDPETAKLFINKLKA